MELCDGQCLISDAWRSDENTGLRQNYRLKDKEGKIGHMLKHVQKISKWQDVIYKTNLRHGMCYA